MKSTVVKLPLYIRRARLDDIASLIDLRKILLDQGVGHYVSETVEDERLWKESYRDWLMKKIENCSNVSIIVSCVFTLSAIMLLGLIWLSL